MTIEAELFDGTVLEFPDGTAQSVIQSKVKELTAQRQQQQPQQAATSTVQPESRGFLGTMGHEISEGLGRISGSRTPTGLPLPQAHDVALGLLQTFFAPVTATGQVVEDIAKPYLPDEPARATDPARPFAISPSKTLNLMTQMVGAPKAISAATPKIMQGVQAMGRNLPGAQVTLREMGKKVIDAIPSALKPAVSSDTLYAEVNLLNPKVKLPEFQQQAQKIAKTEAELAEFGLANQGLASTVSKTAKATTQPTESPAMKWLGDEFNQELEAARELKDLPFSLVEKIRQRLGARIGELRVGGGEELGSYKQLYKTLSKGLEQSADEGVGLAYSKLREANTAANREFAIGELDDIFNSTMGLAREGTAFTSSNFAQALNKVRKLRRDDELFAKGIGAKDLDRIEKTLDELRQIKVLPPPKGVNVGSALVLGKATLGAGVGGYLGGQPGAYLGGAASVAVPWVVSRVIQSEKGSKALLSLLKREGAVSPEHISALVGLVRSEEVATKEFREKFDKSMKSENQSLDEKIQAALDRESKTKDLSQSMSSLAEY